MNFKDHTILYRKLCGITAVYSTLGGVTSFTCVPEGMEEQIKPAKLFRECNPVHPHVRPEPMVQISLTGDELLRDFSAGTTLCNASTAIKMRAGGQTMTETEGAIRIETELLGENGVKVRHFVCQQKGYRAAEMYTEIENASDGSVTLELAASFVLNGLSPFTEENHAENLILHRLQNNWSGEGRRESVPLTHYNMEDSWSSLGVRDQRIGQLGSMPARGYLPFIALEDTEAGVIWAVQLQAPGSWQIETFAKNCALTLCGGLADYLFGHWRKTLAPGERLVTPKAYFTCVQGGLTEACAALTDYQETLLRVPASEESLPILYNEYLCTWGDPAIERLRPQMKLARELGAEYFVVDAGWFCMRTDSELGDWKVNPIRLPQGLEGLKRELDEAGFRLGGVWYEFEGVTENSELAKRTDWLLKLDGKPIKRGGRMLLDFRVPEVEEYLTRKVIDRLKGSGLRYIKIDYNENVGFGTHGAESPGEGLRQHLEGVVRFYRKLRAAMPDLVMEVCSSGGMRHEPLFMSLGSMVSFSDAHEGPEGTVIAADLHRVMQPRIMQIWAGIKPEYSESDIYFTMAKAMLGRICLSGDLTALGENALRIVGEGTAYYRTIKHILRHGTTVLIDTDEISSLRHLSGAVRLCRISQNGEEMLCYAFSIHQPPRPLRFDTKGFRLVSSYGDGTVDGSEVITSGARWSGTVTLWRREAGLKN